MVVTSYYLCDHSGCIKRQPPSKFECEGERLMSDDGGLDKESRAGAKILSAFGGADDVADGRRPHYATHIHRYRHPVI